MERCFEDCKFYKPVFLFGRLNIKTNEIRIDKAILINGILTISKTGINFQNLPTDDKELEVGDLYVKKGTLKIKEEKKKK